MSDRYHNPNPYYYDKKGGIKHDFWDEGSNPKLAEYGAKNRLPCGGKWIIGKDFAFCIEFAADSYNHMAQVLEFGENITDKWHELKEHLLKVEWNLHTLKSRNEVAEDLGITK